MIHDLRHHIIFLITFALGLVAGGIAWAIGMPWAERLLVGANSFFLTYLVAASARGRKMETKGWRRHADDQDEGMPLIVFLAIGAVAVSMIAILMALNATGAAAGAQAAGHSNLLRPVLALSLLSVPLGWAMIHMMFAFHYGGLWYARTGDGKDAGGLDFPGGIAEPQFWEFIYYSFTLGMTAQTSDVGIKTTNLRRVTVLHGALSFFYNTVLIALSVNAALSLGQ